ncbi:hypothetical protein K435DRAFT_969263 [Dendrothele bispora CBS 962.96]|uniref:Uncharacterized protein n=1 Tax=Dendrothele bispora (strain CBS 962.96) TaxID=1314807 RepID=A0A4S8LIX0_DENBC|nr:hypothetical protein K435DRAFT_969263 [Dendrothele bispora CBS 962.96]
MLYTYDYLSLHPNSMAAVSDSRTSEHLGTHDCHTPPTYTCFSLNQTLRRLEAKIDSVAEKAELVETRCVNLAIRRRNFAIYSYESVSSEKKVMVLPRKENAGDGVHLANALLPEGLVPLAPFSDEKTPDVGSAPNNGTVDVNIPLSHQEILKLIQFYNEDFGILSQDDLCTRQIRFQRWLRT